MKKQKAIIISFTFAILFILTSSAIGEQFETQGFNLYFALPFGGKANLQANIAPTLSYPNPSNNSEGILTTLYEWNITIQDADADTFNWTITVNGSGIGYNASTGDTDGNKIVNISGNLTINSMYTIWVNATDGNHTVNETFLFYTANETIFMLLDTLSFGGKANVSEPQGPVLTNPIPTNQSTGVSIETSFWNITITDPSTFNWSIDTVPDVGNNSNTTDTTGIKNTTLTSLQLGTTYTVYVNTTNNEGIGTNETFWFKIEYQYGPTLSYPNPANTSTGNSLLLSIWNITIEDPEGDLFNWTIESNLSSNSTDSDSNGSKNIYIYGNLSYGVTYYVYVNATENNSGNFTRALYEFTTKNQDGPIFSNPIPTNGTTGVKNRTYEWNITIEDPQGDNFNWTIQTSPNIGINTSNNSANGSYIVNITSNLTYDTTYTVWVNASEINMANWTREFFTFTTETNPAPILSYPNPANRSQDVSSATNAWNITTTSTLGHDITWNIETSPNIGSDSGVGSNGSKPAALTYPQYNTNYTVYVNVTDGYNATNETFWFVMEAGNINVTINGSSYVEETNATLFGYVENNDSNNLTCFFEWKEESSDFTTPDGNESAGVVAQGSTFSLNATSLSNGTLHYARTTANNSFGWNASWNSTYFLTKPQPATGLTATEIGGGFNISWTNGDGKNVSYLVVNTTHVPDTRTDGTNIYYGPNNWHEHEGLDMGQVYYYRIWEYANWSNPTVYEWSDGNYSISDTFKGNMTIFSYPNPANNSVDIPLSTTIWNITIEAPSGHTFNWTINSSIGNNGSNADSNGSKQIEIAGNLSYSTTYTIWVNATEPTEVNWTNETFQFTTVSNNAPVFSYPVPTNGSIDVAINLYFWNITIEDPEGDTFDWSIETSPYIGTNSSTGSTNGSFLVNVSGNLSFYQTITVLVNVTDGNDSTNETFWFTAKDLNWTTFSFGGKANISGYNPVLSNEQPANQLTNVDMYPMLNITVNEPQGQKFNITWLTNASGSWVEFAYNSSCSNGTYRQRALWANESNTIYGWQLRVNDTSQNWTNATYWFETATYTWSNWSAWWTFNYTCCAPNNFVATTYNQTVINLTWAACDSADTNLLVVNESGWTSYPLSPTNGTLLDNGTNLSYNHTNLTEATYYYYTIWGWNETEGDYSIINNTAFAATQGNISTYGPYPANQSTANNRPPANISIQINGTGLDIYYYYWNMSVWPNAYSTLYTWTTRDTARYEVLNIDTNWSTSFEWGNHDYNWSVNITDGVTWNNNSYIYTTKGSRYDVTNSGDVISGDVSATWANRQGVESYDGIYDVDHSGDVVSGDLSLIWANRT